MTGNGVFVGWSTASIAVDLGWRFAELYHFPRLTGPPSKQDVQDVPPHLPGLGEMTYLEKACALWARMCADLVALWSATGVQLPDTASIDEVLATLSSSQDDVRRCIYDLYIRVRDCLAGGDPALALAFGLGRMLADTVMLPTAEHPEQFAEVFEKWRLGNAFEWLDDLDAALPPRSAAAVRASLVAWEDWYSQATARGLTLQPPIMKGPERFLFGFQSRRLPQ